MTAILINIRLLKSVALAASTEQTRYYLNGVHVQLVDEKTVHFAGTDGKGAIMARQHLGDAITPRDSEALRAGVIVPLTLINSIKVNRHADYAELTIAGGTASIHYNASTTTAPLIDATYPNYRGIVPKAFDGVPAQYDPEQLMTFKKAHKLLGLDGVPVVTYNGQGPAHVAVVPPYHSKEYEVFGVIMPMRTPNAAVPYFEWVYDTPTSAATSAAA